jgi:hypothetical protein
MTILQYIQVCIKIDFSSIIKYSMYLLLPVEIRLIIAKTHHETWFVLVQVDRTLAKLARRLRLELEDKFTICVSANCTISAYCIIRITLYKLPNGVLHRSNDKPAIVHKSALYIWYQYGRIMRDNDKPAVVLYNSLLASSIFVEPLKENTSLSALSGSNSIKYYQILQDIMWYSGMCEWYVVSILHHIMPVDHSKIVSYLWYCNGVLHRVNNPAVIAADGRRLWFYHGVEYRSGKYYGMD